MNPQSATPPPGAVTIRAGLASRHPDLRPTVTIDGHDLGTAVRRITLDSEYGFVPHVELVLDVVAVDLDGGGVAVHIPTDTRDALIALGWTPPGAAEGGPF